MKPYLFIFVIFVTTSINAKTLDRIVAIVGTKVITKSEVDRIIRTLSSRKEISPYIYKDSLNPNSKEIVDFLIDSTIIETEVANAGYEVSDREVEGEIEQTEQRLGLTRNDLLEFLASKNIEYEEYFAVVRQMKIFSFFNGSIIAPLVSVSEQEIKNTFFKDNKSQKSLSYKYNITGFSIPEKALGSSLEKENFLKSLKNYRITGSLPILYQDLATVEIGEVTEDGLSERIIQALQRTNEGDFSYPILIGDKYHCFFIKSKDLVESRHYIENKERIRQNIIQDKAEKVKLNWLDNQRDKFHIKVFL